MAVTPNVVMITDPPRAMDMATQLGLLHRGLLRTRSEIQTDMKESIGLVTAQASANRDWIEQVTRETRDQFGKLRKKSKP